MAGAGPRRETSRTGARGRRVEARGATVSDEALREVEHEARLEAAPFAAAVAVAFVVLAL